MPICTVCLQEKPQELFAIALKAGSVNYRNTVELTEGIKYHTFCKECNAKKQKTYRDAHPGLWKKYAKTVTTGKIKKIPEEDRALISAIRSKVAEARTNNKRYPDRKFTIDADYMYQLWKDQKGLCYLTGVPMIIKKLEPNNLSIDKIKPESGYIKGNVKWACWAANRAKGDMSIELLVRMCKRILEKCRDYRTDTLVKLEEEPSRVESSDSKCIAPDDNQDEEIVRSV